MGKSQETFSKKEREKKKQKKKELKAKRKEERKNNPTDKGDNLTYVDVYGNFHDTPPPPPEKKVKAKNIVLGVPKREEGEDDVDPVHKGVVSFFNTSKGYGFIKDKDTGESVFVHANNLEEEIIENNLVTFEVEQGPKGPMAVKVKVSR